MMPLMAAGPPDTIPVTVERGLFRRYLADERQEIDHHIRHVLGSERDAALGGEVIDLLLRGKRLRGAMTMVIFDALAGPGGDRRRALDMAAAVEIAHSVSLMIDDILDGDKVRRGVPALHVRLGPQKAFLGAVGALSLPYSIAARGGEEYVALMAAAHRSTVHGASKELGIDDIAPTLGNYEALIAMKTGALFELACLFGAMAAGADGSLVSSCARFGMAIGKVHQLSDDIVDLGEHRHDGSGSMLQLFVRTKVGGEEGADEVRGLLETLIKEAEDLAKDIAHDGRGSAGPRNGPARSLQAVPSEIARIMSSEGRV